MDPSHPIRKPAVPVYKPPVVPYVPIEGRRDGDVIETHDSEPAPSTFGELVEAIRKLVRDYMNRS